MPGTLGGELGGARATDRKDTRKWEKGTQLGGSIEESLTPACAAAGGQRGGAGAWVCLPQPLGDVSMPPHPGLLWASQPALRVRKQDKTSERRLQFQSNTIGPFSSWGLCSVGTVWPLLIVR